mgnify:CR=1 FL=1
MVDLSGSVDTYIQMQLNALGDLIEDPTVLPRDGSVYVAVLAFAYNPWNPSDPDREVPLTALASQAVAETVGGLVRNLRTDNSNANPALDRAEAILSYEGHENAKQFVIFSTDGYFSERAGTLGRCEAFRDESVTVCTAGLAEGCFPAPAGLADWLQEWANSVESGPYDHPPAGEWACITPGTQQENEIAFQELCKDCVCVLLHAGEDDCDGNGIPDVCEIDCNNNGTADPCDILNETSKDCNENWIPDECETGPDCNENGVPDECEIDESGSAPGGPYFCNPATGFELPGGGTEDCDPDCNDSGVPDACETDCNANTVPDDCDIHDLTSLDRNYNGIPDECEGGTCGGPIYVDQNPAIAGTRDGTSWTTAFATLQQGLTEASARLGQSCEGYIFIHVADGTYRPDEAPKTQGDRGATYQLLNRVGVIGGFAGYDTVAPNERLPQVYRTILSGDLDGDDVPADFPNGNAYDDNSYHVVTGSGTDETAVLDGVFIVSGNANGASPDHNGGGVYCYRGGSPKLVNCVIGHNWAGQTGGGLYLYGSEGSMLTLINCLIAGNASAIGGAGIYVQNVGAAILHCTIANNAVRDNADTGGAYLPSASTIANSILWGNTGRNYGPLGWLVTTGRLAQLGPAEVTVSYSNVEGGWPAGVHNINLNPLFVAADGSDEDPATWADNDYRLADGSPCLGKADENAPGLPVFDFEHDLRVLNCRLDMGADESSYFLDCNGNEQADGCDIETGSSEDCNENGIPDECDIISGGGSSDCNANGVPDDCEVGVRSFYDFDFDCDVDQVDFGMMQRCRTELGVTVSNTFPDGSCDRFDFNADNYVTAAELQQCRECCGGPALPPPSGENGICGPAVQPVGNEGGEMLDDCDPPVGFAIVAWRSVRAHGGSSEWAIALDAAATAEDAVSESRLGSTQIIEVDFNMPAWPETYAELIHVYGSDESTPEPDSFAFLNGNTTFRMVFTDDSLADQVCYRFDLSQAFADAGLTTVLTCDTDCWLRNLAGDVDSDGVVTEDDEDAVALGVSDPVSGDNAGYDVNADGAINATDTALVGVTWLGHEAECVEEALGKGMMMAGGPGLQGSTLLERIERAMLSEPADSRLSRDASTSSKLAEPSEAASAESQALPARSAVSGWAWLVEHGTGEGAVKLPAKGGSVWVDVVVSAEGPVLGFAGRLAADVAEVVSVATAGWTAEDNVACWADASQCELGGWYELGAMEWYAIHADESIALGTSVAQLADPTLAAVWTTSLDLSALAGPIALPASAGELSLLIGDGAATTDTLGTAMDDAAKTADDSAEATGALYVTAGALGGLTPGLTEAGQWVVATLRLDIAPGADTVRLLPVDAYAVDATGSLILLTPGPALEITVDQE